MTDKYIVNYSESQLRRWVEEHVNITKKHLKTSTELANYVTFLPPPRLFKRVSRLVKDECVNPADIKLVMLTEGDERFDLNIDLESIYSLVYTDSLSA